MSTEHDIRDLLAAADEAIAEAGFRTGDFGQARELLEAARAEAAASADLSVQARVLELQGMLAHYQNISKLMSGEAVPPDDVAAEERLFRQAIACWQRAGLDSGSAQSLFGLGLVFQVLHSDWAAAMPYYWQALGLVSDPSASASQHLRSEVHRHIGFYFLVEACQPTEAVRHLQISLDLREEAADERMIPSGLQALAEAEIEAGNRELAIDLLSRAVARAREAHLLPARIQAAESALAAAQEAGQQDQG